MVKDFANGLKIVPLYPGKPILDNLTVSDVHPYLFQERAHPPPDEPSTNIKLRCVVKAPACYNTDEDVHGPDGKDDHLVTFDRYRGITQDYVRICDVEDFRKRTAQKAQINAGNAAVDGLSVRLSHLSTSSRPLIYRFIDVIQDSMAFLEAINFELFMPDRPDLRFIATPFATLPSDTVERDFFLVPDANLLPNPSFSIKLGNKTYPVVWEAQRIQMLRFDEEPKELCELAYIVKGKESTGGSVAYSEFFDRDLVARDRLFDADSARDHAIMRIWIRRWMTTSHLYPVEPPRRHKDHEGAWSRWADDERRKSSRLREYHYHDEDNGEKQRVDYRSEYVKRIAGVRTYSQRPGAVVTHVQDLDEDEAERIEDRLGAFTTYGEDGDLELMAQLFRLGSRYRQVVSASRGTNTGEVSEMRINESIILKTISDRGIGHLSNCRPLLDCIYGAESESGAVRSLHRLKIPYRDGGELLLNRQQSRAVRLYRDADGPRVFCILSPPGSGKTTVAAAMAAVVALRNDEDPDDHDYDGVQLLLSVQNVAVDNIGAALKKKDYGEGEVYNMKSSVKMDPDNSSPFDYFDLLDEDKLETWQDHKVGLEEKRMAQSLNPTKRSNEDKKLRKLEEYVTHHRREFEKKVCPKIILSTVEMVMQKMYTPSKLCRDLANVSRVIIDEASLLTEAALFCVIRRFPKARIVLIGDDKQLPPFMYEKNILGHELAGRPALTVAMKTGRVPVVELNEVYRAPPSLVAPYNRLAYGGRLVSRKEEGRQLLTEVGLIKSGLPQLLLIDVNGKEVRNDKTMSLYNEQEIQALQRLLKKLPRKWAKRIMIICLYKEQQKRVQEFLDTEYESEAVSERQYTVFTVDSAQGKEKSILIVMTTRTEKATDFFCSTERCTVAVSRQKEALIVLGKAAILTTRKPWSTVVNGDNFTRIRAEDVK